MSAFDNGVKSSCSVKKTVINGYSALIMENGLLRAVILTDKGTDIVQLVYLPLNLDLLWKLKRGIPSKEKLVYPPQEDTFMSTYGGGWQEIFPAGSGGCVYRGTEFYMHDEVAVLPWDINICMETPQEIKVKFSVRSRKTALTLEKTLSMRTGEAVLYIREEVVNHGEETDFIWGHHPAFGAPFIGAGCRIRIPAAHIHTMVNNYCENSFVKAGMVTEWPYCYSPDGLLVDMSLVYPPEFGKRAMVAFSGLEKGEYSIINDQMKLGILLEWDEKVMPYVWGWLSYNGEKGPPWHGDSYLVALEPWSSRIDSGFEGINEAVLNKTSLKIKKNGKLRFSLKASVFNT